VSYITELHPEYPRLYICRGRTERAPDVWIMEWIWDLQEGPDLYLIVHSSEDKPSAAELYEASIDYECPVTLDD
jgi:hypothetical protein